MTTTPHEPLGDPDVVPSGDPAENPDVGPGAEPAPEPTDGAGGDAVDTDSADLDEADPLEPLPDGDEGQ